MGPHTNEGRRDMFTHANRGKGLSAMSPTALIVSKTCRFHQRSGIWMSTLLSTGLGEIRTVDKGRPEVHV